MLRPTGIPRHYFDANASAPPLPEVIEVVQRAMMDDWANPTSIHREGQRARFRLEEARRVIAQALRVPPGELVFCTSATEALNLLLRGLQPALGDKPAAVFPGEHSACLNPLREWTDMRFLPCDLAAVSTVIQMAASNETGIRYEMPQVPGAIRIRDCVQAWGKVDLDLEGCDAAVFSGHKMGGPRGAALLWMRPGLPWTAWMEGPQERRRRGGTEDLPAIVGLAEAVKHLPERIEANARLGALRDSMEAEIRAWSPDFEVVGRAQERLPNTSCVLFHGFSGEALQVSLDLAGFAVSTGSACHSGAVEPSHALLSMGYSETESRSALRISMLPDTEPEALKALLKALKRSLEAKPTPDIGLSPRVGLSHGARPGGLAQDKVEG